LVVGSAATVAVLVLLTCATPSGAQVGDLAYAGCMMVPEGPGCKFVSGMTGPTAVAVSPDGRNVYVAAESNALIVFSRAEDGQLTYLQCVGNMGEGAPGPKSCTSGSEGLDEPKSIAISPDGSTVYVASFASNALLVLGRAANGELTAKGCVGNSESSRKGPPACIGAEGLAGPEGVVVSPDGKDVYTTGYESNSVNLFERAGNGDVKPFGCIGNDVSGSLGPPSCEGAEGLAGPSGLAVSPDGATLYVTGYRSHDLDVFGRNPATGGLTGKGCVGNTPAESGERPGPPSCIGSQGLQDAYAVVVSPNGGSVHVASSLANAVVSFSRAGNGDATPVQCLGNDEGALEQPGPAGCAPGQGLRVPDALAVSPDGADVYVAAQSSNTVDVLGREATGSLAAHLCLRDSETSATIAPSCGTAPELKHPAGVAVSPDGKNVYVASTKSNALVVFNRAVATPPSGGSGGTTPPAGNGGPTTRTQTSGATVGNQQLTLSTTLPVGCITSTATLATGLKSARLAHSSSTGTVLFASASFFIDRGVAHVHRRVMHRHGRKVTIKRTTYTANRTVTKLPASVALSLKGLKSGQHTLRVVVSFHRTTRRHGRPHTVNVTQTLTQTFNVC
jgi:DNA-binding beta-propeller fold protein YncE